MSGLAQISATERPSAMRSQNLSAHSVLYFVGRPSFVRRPSFVGTCVDRAGILLQPLLGGCCSPGADEQRGRYVLLVISQSAGMQRQSSIRFELWGQITVGPNVLLQRACRGIRGRALTTGDLTAWAFVGAFAAAVWFPIVSGLIA